jgi:Na+/melibiose symporter-like transporter
MVRGAQFGIALGVLGIMLTFMGLFPGVTGVQPVAGIGIAQIFSILAGFTLLIFGGLIYVEYSFYAHVPANLAQQIGWRVFSALARIRARPPATSSSAHGRRRA